MDIVYIADDQMFPTNSGGRLELLGAGRALRDAGHNLHVVVLHRGDMDAQHRSSIESEFPGARFVRRVGLLRATLRRPLDPYQLTSRSLGADWATMSFPEIDVVVANHEYTLEAAGAVGRRYGAPVVLRSHNDEVAYSRSLVRNSRGLKWPYLFAEFLRLRAAMRRGLLSHADAIALISENDRPAYARFPGPVEYVPPSLVVGEAHLHAEPPTDPVVGFIGALDSSHTEEGLAWFVREAWPEVRRQRPDARLLLAGRRASARLTRILKAGPGVDFLGEVDTATEIYRRTRVFVNPIFDGSGINMKLGGPAQAGVPIVTTGFGVRGLSALEHAVLTAERTADFADAVIRVLDSDDEWRRCSEAGVDAVLQHQSASVAAAFQSLFNVVLSEPERNPPSSR